MILILVLENLFLIFLLTFVLKKSMKKYSLNKGGKQKDEIFSYIYFENEKIDIKKVKYIINKNVIEVI